MTSGRDERDVLVKEEESTALLAKDGPLTKEYAFGPDRRHLLRYSMHAQIVT